MPRSATRSTHTGVSGSDLVRSRTAKDALDQLDDEFNHWPTGVRALGTSGLTEPQGEPPAFAHAPVAKLFLYSNVELIHHGAEISLLRDLYLHKGLDQR